jgi:hypothetical protein
MRLVNVRQQRELEALQDEAVALTEAERCGGGVSASGRALQDDGVLFLLPVSSDSAFLQFQHCFPTPRSFRPHIVRRGVIAQHWAVIPCETQGSRLRSACV